MKTKLISFMVILFIVMIFASIVQAAPAGKITNLDGRVDVTVPGQPARPSSIGDMVNVGDVIRTKSASKCEVTWVDGSVTRLAENSRLRVTEFMLEKEKRSVSFNLFRGKMQNVVKSAEQLLGPKGASKYEVHTPTTVCGVRGTNFFIYHQAGVSGAIFTEGHGYGYSKGKPDQVKNIASGQAMVVTSADKAPVVKTATPAEINKMMKDTAVSEKKETKKSGDATTSGSGESTSGSTLGSPSGGTNLGGDPWITSGSGTVIGGSAGAGSSTGGITAGGGQTTIIPPPYVPPVQPPPPVVPSPTLLFSGSFSGDIYQTVKDTLYIKSYQKPTIHPTNGYFDTFRYETAYFGSENVKYGWQMDSYEQRDSRTQNRYRTNFTYHPNNTYDGFMVYNGVPAIYFGGYTSQTTSNTFLGNVWPDLGTSPPTVKHVWGGTTAIETANIISDVYPVSSPIAVDPALNQYVKVSSQTVADFYMSIRLQPDSATPAFQGDMGFYRKYGDPDTLNLWNATATQPLSLQLQGTHIPFSGSAAMMSLIRSATPDGGAYAGWFGNMIASDLSANGFFTGLYVSPAGEAGFLKADSISGTSDGSSIWKGTGDIYSVKKIDGSAVAANVLLQQDANGNYVNLKVGFMVNDVNNGGVKGDFVSASGSSGSIESLGMMQGGTYTIKGYPSWGIFTTGMLGTGTFSNPSGETKWRADFAGYGTFGVNETLNDFGYWHISVADTNQSSWINNKISAPITGEFLTYKKLGTISGNFDGTYGTTSGTTSGRWGGTAGGTWEKTRDVAFSSGLDGRIYNLRKWTEGTNSTAGYQYYISGDITNSAEKIYADKWTTTGTPTVRTRYDSQGYSDDTHPPAYNKVTWKYTLTGTSPNYGISSAQLVEASTFASETAYRAEIQAMRTGASESTGLDMMDTRNLNGILAGFNNNTDNKNLWENIALQQSTALALAGLYDAWDNKAPTLMTANFASFDPTVSMSPYSNSQSPIGGAYYGYLTAAFGKKTRDADTLDGNINALYLSPAGKLGILYGTFSGSNLPDIGAWKGSGNIKGYEIVTAPTGITAANFAGSMITSSSEYRFYGPAYLSGYQVGMGGSAIYTPFPDMGGSTSAKYAYWISESAALSSGIFGIFKLIGGGIYDPNETPTYKWNNQVDYNSGGYLTSTMYNATDWDNPNTTPNTVASNVFNGSVLHDGVFDPTRATGRVAAVINYSVGSTAVHGADIKGLFDPNKSTWQAVSDGTSIETTAFMNLVNNLTTQAQKEAFMAAMKIPCINVGQVDLSGSRTTTGDSLTVNMQGVTFYAFSTGQVPRLWATKNVTGTYDVTPSGAMPTAVPLTSSNVPNLSGVSATFTPKVWGTTTWGGEVTGTGTMASPATNIIFKGGAAGSKDSSGTRGNFSGTGAGIVRAQ